MSTRSYLQQVAARLLVPTSPQSSPSVSTKPSSEPGPLAKALLDRLSDLVSSQQNNPQMAMITPFLPLLKMHVSTQSDEDIRNSLESVLEFILGILDPPETWCDGSE